MSHFGTTEPLLTPNPHKSQQLRRLLKQAQDTGNALVLPGAFNAVTAKLVQSAGFSAGYLSGAGVVNATTGYPDIGMLGATEMATLMGYAARAVDIPLLADADTGYGEAINTFRTVQLYEREGISGLHLEDQVFPKRCGHLNGKGVIPAEAMAQKLTAALAARQNLDFVIIARVDSKSILGLEDALSRARLYLDTGADAIFIEALESETEFGQFAQQLRATHPNSLLLANMTEFGKTPLITAQQFGAMGYTMVIFPMTAFRVLLKAGYDTYETLATTGTQTELLNQMWDRKTLYDLLHYPLYEQLDTQLERGPYA